MNEHSKVNSNRNNRLFFQFFYVHFKSLLQLERMLINEPDLDMKELYKNELADVNAMISELDCQLTESYFEFKNEGINEVMVEIRAGNRVYYRQIFIYL